MPVSRGPVSIIGRMWQKRLPLGALSLALGLATAACSREVESSMRADTTVASPSSRLEAAVQADDPHALRAALAAGADPNTTTAGGRPLLVQALVSNSRGSFERLLQAGADAARPDAGGQCAMHWAAMNESPWWLQTLLAHHADPNVPNARTQDRPLMDAMLSHRDGHLALLLQAGADPNARDSEGATALHVAASTKRARYSLQLLQAGADPLAQDSFGKTFQAYQWLGREDLLLPQARQEREAVRQWLKDHHIAVQAH